MATDLRPISVAAAGPIMAKALKMDWSVDRAEVVEYLNKYRELLYTMYREHGLFDDVFYCISVETFNRCCGNQPQYRGFSVPQDVASIEAAYRNDDPLTLRSRWREMKDGLSADLPVTELFPVNELFPTERDLTESSSIGLYTDHEDDNDKVAVIEVLDTYSKKRKITFRLVHNGVVRSKFKVTKVLSVVLPANQVGGITLMQTSQGRTLSEYPPGEHVPVFRRYRIAPTNCPASILIHGNRSFRPVYFDHDIVEVGNRLAMEAGARFFKHSEDTTDAGELKKAGYERALLDSYIGGEISRSEGRSIQDGSPFSGTTSRITANSNLYSR